MTSIIPVERIKQSIVLIRRQKVMLDRDLADLYEVETRVLNQAVGRNIKRFPKDFMFALTQFVISSDIKYAKRVHAFTEQGVAMLSSVLRSDRAIEVNIAIMRAFVQLREMLASNVELARKLKQMEKKYDERFKIVFEAIQQLMAPPETKKKKIGFEVKEPKGRYGKRTGKKRE